MRKVHSIEYEASRSILPEDLLSAAETLMAEPNAVYTITADADAGAGIRSEGEKFASCQNIFDDRVTWYRLSREEQQRLNRRSRHSMDALARLKALTAQASWIRIQGRFPTEEDFILTFYPGTRRVMLTAYNCYQREQAELGQQWLHRLLARREITIRVNDPWLTLQQEEADSGWAALLPAACDHPVCAEMLIRKSDGWSGDTKHLMIDTVRNRCRLESEWYEVRNSHGTDTDEGTVFSELYTLTQAAALPEISPDLRRRLSIAAAAHEGCLNAANELLADQFPGLRFDRVLYATRRTAVFLGYYPDGTPTVVKASGVSACLPQLKADFSAIPEHRLIPVLDCRRISDGDRVLELTQMPWFRLQLLPDLRKEQTEYLLSEKPKTLESVFSMTREELRRKRIELSDHEFGYGELYTLALDIAEALRQLHALGYVHLDVKPEHFFALEAEGRLRWFLGDYGTAVSLRGSAPMHTAGTRLYMAPERLKHGAIRHGADVYSWGVAMLELMLGISLEPTDTLLPDSVSRAAADLERDFRNTTSRLAAGLRDIVLRAISEDPEQRFPDGGALYAALQQLS